jgi:ABC-2 type transport system ATP-binding protein
VLETAGFLVVQAGPTLTVGIRDKRQRFDFSRVTRVLAQHDLYVSELIPVRADLESVFLELTADEHLGATRHVAGPPPAGPPSPGPAPAGPSPETGGAR